MCKASHETGGPLRCSGDARASFGRSQQAVQELEDRSSDLRRRLPAPAYPVNPCTVLAEFDPLLEEMPLEELESLRGALLETLVVGKYRLSDADHGSVQELDEKVRQRIAELEEPDTGFDDPDKAHELWLETRYSEEIAAEEAAERARGAVDFEDAWDAADPVHAAARPLRHAERQAYEEVLAQAMRRGYNQSYGDRLDEEAIDRRADEILAEQGLTRAVIEARIAAAAARSA